MVEKSASKDDGRNFTNNFVAFGIRIDEDVIDDVDFSNKGINRRMDASKNRIK